MTAKRAHWLGLFGLMGLLLPLGSYAQIAGGAMPNAGTISGHVLGPGEVSVPGATVRIIELQTGQRKQTWTDEDGNYTLTGLSPGTYKMEVSLIGFQPYIRQPVAVSAGSSLSVNVALAVAMPELGTTTRQQQGSEPSEIESLLPEVRERLRSLAAVGVIAGGEPGGEATGDAGGGVTGAAGGAGDVRFSDTTGAQSQGGSSSADNDSSSVDASAANSFLLSGSVGYTPTASSDERQDRQAAKESRRSLKSQSVPGFGGGNEFEDRPTFWPGSSKGRPQINRIRGNVFGRYFNSAANARPYPLNVPQSAQIPYFEEQAGGAIGGPLTLPGVYKRRDKTSFFVHYHVQRGTSPFDSFATVPTPLERGGDFSKTVISSGPLAGTVPTIYDPRSNPLGPRTAFPGNMILPPFDPAAVGLLNYIPLPNLPGSVQNFHLQQALPLNNDRVMARIGHKISAKDNLDAFYYFNSARSQTVASFPRLTRNISVRSQNANFAETHTLSSHAANTLVVNFNRQQNQTLNPFAYRQDIAGQFGIQSISRDPRDWGLPIIHLTNFTRLTDAIPSLIRNQTLRVFDFVLINQGRHNVHLGEEMRRVQLNTLADPDARGTFTFSGFTTSNFTARGNPVAGTGFDFADFLLGLPHVTTVRFGIPSNYLRSWVYSSFVLDDWRIASRLTLNLGLRYEFFEPFTEKYHHLSDLAIGPGFSSVEVVTAQSPGLFPFSLIRNDKTNFAPRAGMAFRPWAQRSLVLRAGYGIFYDGSIYQRLVPNLVNQPPFAQASTLTATPAQILTLENGFPPIAPNIARNTYAVDPNFRTPYGQTWNFTIEGGMARNVIFWISYVGTKGTRLDQLLAPNRVLTAQQALPLQGALQFEYETSGAASVYHGLQAGLRRQFHHGFSMSINYTLSKSIDDAASVGGAGNTVAQDYLNLAAERGLSVFDIRHRLTMNHNYEFPFGARHRYLNRGGALAGLLGDWHASGNAQLQSGTPLTARVLGNLSNNTGIGAFGSQRADASGEPVSLPGFEQTTLRYFNTGAFTLPLPGQFGSAGRNTIPGPRLINFNMALGKFVTLSQEKGVRLDFRVEARNIFNTPSYSGLATIVDAMDFGRVTSVRGMRTLDLFMRLRF